MNVVIGWISNLTDDDAIGIWFGGLLGERRFCKTHVTHVCEWVFWSHYYYKQCIGCEMRVICLSVSVLILNFVDLILSIKNVKVDEISFK